MKTFLILIKVFVIGALLIISNENLALSSSENRHQFDHGVVVVGYVVGNQWLPDSGKG